jgi:hypothetical protein
LDIKKIAVSLHQIIIIHYLIPIFMLNIETLKNFIGDGGKATHGKIIAIVEQKMLKRGNPLKDATVTKLVSYISLLNANYQNTVNNALEREGKDKNFVSKENWFTTIFDSFNGSLVAKKSDTNCHYLKMIVKSAKTHKFFVDGIEATEEQMEVIRQFKQSSSPTSQGLDNEIIVRTIKTQNIISVKTGGEELHLDEI